MGNCGAAIRRCGAAHQLGMHYCFEAGKGKVQAKNNLDRLKDLCANPNLNLALNILLDGIAGNGLWGHPFMTSTKKSSF